MATLKRDTLKKIEEAIQAVWESERAFEIDAPHENDKIHCEKFLATFPYPYMNGFLHLGHGFTITKAEFAVAFNRIIGKRSLFPFGFHCTGMPIKASADKLITEIRNYGCPPQVPVSVNNQGTSSLASNTPAKHSKVAAKTGNVKLQWDIMRQLGISDEEIPKFADPQYWITYFPPYAQKHLKALGCHIDWRRSFITTDRNPYYDSFVRWQFNKLRAQNRVKFGKRNTIFSPLDGQPCLDHDRSSGEGVDPKEYTVVRLELLPVPQEHCLSLVQSSCKAIYLGAATLRPETMYGQTNCWVGPEIDYGVYQLDPSFSIERELLICTERAALNMLYQGIICSNDQAENNATASSGPKTPLKVASVKGTDLFGLYLSAPNVASKIPVLPMFSVSPNMGTGIVTSVPSNSPADYVALQELQAKEALRRKFNIADKIVMDLSPIPIIHSPTYGDCSAVTVAMQLGIKSQNDAVNLEKAKDLVYKDDFYSGIMLVGPLKGKSVQEAKETIKAELISQKSAFVYFEPEKEVISRSGDRCVVALTDQWYIDYGETSWRALAEKCVSQMDCYSDEVRRQFMATLDWMRQWACSRSFGLGSRLSWDPTYLIESLSDSTIYMAYYTVSHILHMGSLDGSGTPPNGVTAAMMTDSVWEWIFSASDELEYPESEIDRSILNRMRSEFRFWYPMDLRVTGKDLVPNHLTFSVYNHVALFDERFWPLGMRANGHLLLNSEKMSKSTGNFMTVGDAIAEFGADATRFAFADAGDGVEDANFLKDTVNTAILRLFNQLEFFQEILSDEPTSLLFSENNEISLGFAEKIFQAEIDFSIISTRKAFEQTNFREGLKTGFFDLQNARDRYRAAVPLMNRALIKRFVAVQAALLYPIAPHFSEHVWRNLLKRTDPIIFPVPSAPIDESLISASQYLQSVSHTLRLKLQHESKPKKGSAPTGVVKKANIFVATAYPPWQEDAISVLRANYDIITRKFSSDDVIVSGLKPLMRDRPNKKMIPFVMELKARVLLEGPSVFERSLKFDEASVLEANIEALTRALGISCISVLPVDPASTSETYDDASVEVVRKSCIPGEPSVLFIRE